jgi:hypothetical protein
MLKSILKQSFPQETLQLILSYHNSDKEERFLILTQAPAFENCQKCGITQKVLTKSKHKFTSGICPTNFPFDLVNYKGNVL